jgi:hypothetical protein
MADTPAQTVSLRSRIQANREARHEKRGIGTDVIYNPNWDRRAKQPTLAPCPCNCADCTGKPGCPCKCPNCTCNQATTQKTVTRERSRLLRRGPAGPPLPPGQKPAAPPKKPVDEKTKDAKPPAKATAFIDYNPPGSKGGNILADVRSRCDQQGLANGYDADKVTCCHESTHMVNSRLRSFLGRPGFYVGGGKAVAFRCHPRVTLGTVAKYIKPEFRNSTYQLYFGQQRQWWDKEPLYVLDEWYAYTNGSQAAKELRVDNHGECERAQWFCHYADCLVRAVKEHDPNYSDLDKLTAFVDWQKARVEQLTGKAVACAHVLNSKPDWQFLEAFDEDTNYIWRDIIRAASGLAIGA